MSSKTKPTRGLGLIISVMVVLFAIWYLQHKPKTIDPSKLHGTFLHQPRVLSPFAMQGTTQQAFTNDNLKGHWTLMFFGFTRCPHMCPMTMKTLRETYQQLVADHVKSLPHVVMVTVDPQRDDADSLHRYVTGFNPEFEGAVPDQATLKQITKELGVVFMKVENKKSPEKYNMSHSGTIMLFNPQGQLAGFFAYPQKKADLVADLEMIANSVS